jgi:hypothetical protein
VKAHVDRLVLDLERFWVEARADQENKLAGATVRGVKLPSIARSSAEYGTNEPFYELVRYCTALVGHRVDDPFRYLRRALRPNDPGDDIG